MSCSVVSLPWVFFPCAREKPVNPQLFGRWQNSDASLTLEFRPDGGFVMAQPKVPGGQPARGRYAVVDDTHVRLSFGSGERSIERKSTRLNSSHLGISYAVFCLKKKKNKTRNNETTR